MAERGVDASRTVRRQTVVTVDEQSKTEWPTFELSVAPMMDWTDRHCRYFHRLLHPRVRLFTEMIHANAVIKGDREYLLGFDPAEHPVAVQLGGNEPTLLAEAARICADYGYDEINLNVGCPSDRVQTGAFGACLMAQPERVAACVTAMKQAVDIPVTVKTRIGIDDLDSDTFLRAFIEHLMRAPTDGLIVHARIALLSGLSPKQNREIPPLNYQRVVRMQDAFPTLPIVLNGGITELVDVQRFAHVFTGVMLGRAAYQNPWLLAQVGKAQGLSDRATRADIVRAFLPYAEKQLTRGVRLHAMTRHLLGLFAGQPGARAWRRYLSENSHHAGAGIDILEQALERVDPP
ncbi:MAG: tRNA dihydrouridine(20/20a) synthase DusA [Pseudomonadota bacterium]